MHDSAMRRDKPARLGGAHAGTALYHLEQMFADSAGNLTPAPFRPHVRARDAAVGSPLRARRGGRSGCRFCRYLAYHAWLLSRQEMPAALLASVSHGGERGNGGWRAGTAKDGQGNREAHWAAHACHITLNSGRGGPAHAGANEQ